MKFFDKSKKRTTASFLILLSVLTLFSGCFGSEEPQNTTSAAPVYTPTTSVPETAAPRTEETTAEEEAPFVFDKEKAILLGSFESEIYESLTVYYQEAHLILFDPYGTKVMTLSAHNYEPKYNNTPVEIKGADINFDGYADFALLYSKGELNSYYCCWIWNMQKRTFDYYLPLSSIPSPEFDDEKKKVISRNRTTERDTIITEYLWENGELVPVSHSEMILDPTAAQEGPEDVQTSLTIFDGLVLSSVALNGNKNSSSRWICKIEDESIVKLFSQTFDEKEASYRFIFKGEKPGVTTVVLRYAKSWDSDFIAEKALNIAVHNDKTLTIIETTP